MQKEPKVDNALIGLPSKFKALKISIDNQILTRKEFIVAWLMSHSEKDSLSTSSFPFLGRPLYLHFPNIAPGKKISTFYGTTKMVEIQICKISSLN